jgi:ATP-binding cassette, subfamily B, bacterial
MAEDNDHRTGPLGARETRPVGTLRRLLPQTRPYRSRFAAAALCSLGVLTAQVAQPEVVRRFIDEVLEAGMRERLVGYALLSLALGVTWTSLAFTRRHISGRIALGLEFDLRNWLYKHLQSLAVDFHDGWQSGDLVSRAVSDISRIRRYVGFGLVFLFQMGMQIILVLTQLVRIDAGLALLAVAFTSPVALVSYRFSRLYHQISRQSQDEQGDLTTIVEESATGVRVIKAFGRMPERSALYRKQAEKLYTTNMRGVAARKTLWSLDVFLLGMSIVAILLWGGMRAASGAMTIGALAEFVLYQQMLTWPIREMGWIIAMGQEASAAAERVFELLDTKPDIADEPGSTPLLDSRGEIALSDVWFKYPESDAWVLKGVDLDVRSGETLALVGMTGSGKTTVAALVSRFYDPTSGRVTLDGRDIKDITVSSLRSHATVAFEDPILFSVSIRENILMGKPDGTDADVWEALVAAQADEFVRELPWGLDTRVGEQGYSLSGGQRQRVALARAIIGRPRILILDNPLSSVDVHTEAAIELALRDKLANSTALLIAHRPSTLLLADRVAFLHEGRVRAVGTHHDLLGTEPLYRRVLTAEDDESDLDAEFERMEGEEVTT